mmetsp:Transcript_41711/g.68625  ORF Transcript_41711/g.68625 Transcript_41711/m.68625 type:complete len:571 (-) Transcript_41711:158-1870(-)|eukprot:CAMPEP_0202696718 /NCGR_PEP_ID=MMETSP1385-20130828/10034_1 /ASSEMBLY_ACC=CAM_ASM_000861 /TAXON_ID=933848 /ORGANISM="Elphidium margaritaceum" /LENGTH=570 /DNA_ID=CAMNT_0049352971 /DNA_START=26 /DNA_END=1738 /DNA_ORIENTATION=-
MSIDPMAEGDPDERATLHSTPPPYSEEAARAEAARTEVAVTSVKPADVETDAEEASPNSFIGRVENYFQLRQRRSTWLTELRAGTVTFITMSYILAVNAQIIAETGGPCGEEFDLFNLADDDIGPFLECQEIVRLDLITATATGALIACLCMGLAANMPIGMAPGMGINAYFTYSVVGPWYSPGKVNYNTAMMAVFIEGWIFIILAVTGLRVYIAKLIPAHLKCSITVGIGMFLALIGLQKDEGIGLVVSNGATNVTLGGCGHTVESGLACNDFGLECGCAPGTVLEGATTWLGIIGLLIILISMINKVKGGIMIGILFVSFVSWFRNTQVTYFPDNDAGNARFEYFKKVVAFHRIEKTGGALFRNLDFGHAEIWTALLTMLYVDVLDTTGTLYSMAQFSGLMDKSGNFPRSTAAFCSDALGTVVGSILGTTDITAYIESGSGIQEGGSTGITAIVVGLLFFLSLFFTPILSSIPPWATGPALIIIGAMMMDSVNNINWRDLRQAVPAFLTMIIMPFTYSIAYGIIAGLATHFIILATDKLFDLCCSRIPAFEQFNAKRYTVEEETNVAE